MKTQVLIDPEIIGRSGERPVYIDTRPPEAYAAGHIPGAFNMRDIFTYLATSTQSGLLELKDKFSALFGAIGVSGNEWVIVYEDALDNGFGQSCRGYYLLKYLGYEKVSVLHGGLQAWMALGLPTNSEIPIPPAHATFPVAINHRLMVTKSEMQSALFNSSIIKLDVRDAPEWNGLTAMPSGNDPALRVGRIPGSKWIEWQKFFDPDAEVARFLTATEIRALLDHEGIAADTEIYIYCYKGSRAANTLVALHRAGFENARVYFGSWNEWARDCDMPIEVEPQAAYAT